MLAFPTEDNYCISQCFQARPVDYTPSQASAKHISLNLARVQRMRDQTLLDLWRSRDVADIVKLDKDPVQPGLDEVKALLKQAEEQATPAIAARKANNYEETESLLKPMDQTLKQAKDIVGVLLAYDDAKAQAIRLLHAGQRDLAEPLLSLQNPKIVDIPVVTLDGIAGVLGRRQYADARGAGRSGQGPPGRRAEGTGEGRRA